MGARKSFLNEQVPPHRCTKTKRLIGSIEDLESFLEPVKNDKNIFIHSYSPSELKHRQFGKPRTAIKAYKKGHNNLAVWQYANWLKVVRVQRGEIVKIEKIGKYEGFVLDIDNHESSSIQEMLNFIKKNDIPRPSLIVQTSFHNFHVMYMAPKGYWSNFRKKQIAFWFSGEKDIIPSDDKYLSSSEEEILLKGKIDVNYMRQVLENDVYCKFRVPGSTNYLAKKRDSSGRIYDYQTFTCVGWTNQNYNKENPLEKIEKYQAHDNMFAEHIDENNYWKKYIDRVYKQIRIYMPDKAAEKWAFYLCKNLSRIKNKALVISQDRAAEEMKISQMTVSRHIKILKENGFLEVEKEYMYIPGKKGLGRARVYRAGEKLSDIVGFKKKANINAPDDYEITKKYQKGDTWLHFLSDVRYLYKQGCTEAQAIFLIELKMREKNKRGYRGCRDVKRAYRQWHRKNINNKLDVFISRPDKPKIDVYEIAKNI